MNSLTGHSAVSVYLEVFIGWSGNRFCFSCLDILTANKVSSSCVTVVTLFDSFYIGSILILKIVRNWAQIIIAWIKWIPWLSLLFPIHTSLHGDWKRMILFVWWWSLFTTTVMLRRKDTQTCTNSYLWLVYFGQIV